MTTATVVCTRVGAGRWLLMPSGRQVTTTWLPTVLVLLANLAGLTGVALVH